MLAKALSSATIVAVATTTALPGSDEESASRTTLTRMALAMPAEAPLLSSGDRHAVAVSDCASGCQSNAA
jgi:hypothetical protein